LAEAEDYFLRALDVDSTNIESNYILANLQIEKGELAQAEKRYLKILEINPEESQTHLALAVMYLEDPARHAEALEHFRFAARLIPEHAESIRKNYILPLEMERSGRAVIEIVP
jgi:Tfp pilus assembly protein PilF